MIPRYQNLFFSCIFSILVIQTLDPDSDSLEMLDPDLDTMNTDQQLEIKSNSVSFLFSMQGQVCIRCMEKSEKKK
jgi:hypothetical protein